MTLPDEYKTGNSKMDELIAKQLAKEGSRMSYEAFVEQVKQHKYGVSSKEDRTFSDGTVFASKKEMERWDYLLMIQRAGQISNLQTQVPFLLQEAFISKHWGEVRSISYVADFVYTNISFRKEYPGRQVVEDSKGGILTKEYKLKRKMFLYKYGSYLFFEVK